MRGTSIAFALFLAACMPAEEPGPRCNDRDYHWSATEPSINLRHVFCGDINRRGRVVGFHATLAVGQPGVPVIVEGSVEPSVSTGVFTADIRFPDGRTKFSTFFPEPCSEAQIVASILHAASRSQPTEPWGFVGPSAPNDGDMAGYCLDDSAPFPIRIGTLGEENDRINTAFPQ